ncbi:unnamed protein product [Cyberlindnera jadinii]|uniref:PCI domain-containing protein n=1 Tax=Cyberlindnera jadinii (strain ATCC 18201 / CBS 1600 / BCRC 20928 / JCM 3617 / NBRC 0987 / NRRL Y-1542) TaxID=983966 RepID=A0A0H5CBI8_CYBJN|nr:unnamed protein product [Cyberlindnera jadinii]
MSDEDDFMMSDGESYEFEFEDDDDERDDHQMEGSDEGNDEGSPESLYYKAKSVKQDDPKRAIEIFSSVLDCAGDNTETVEYKFKSLKQILKLLYKHDDADDLSEWALKIFDLPLEKLPRGYVEDSFSRMLEAYSGAPKEDQLHFLETFLSKFHGSDRITMKASLKRIFLLLELRQFDRMLAYLARLHTKLDSMPEITRNAYLLELYAIEIQAYSETNNVPKLRELYKKTLSIQSTIPHPSINAVVKECGGKMHMRDENYELASDEFYESFKNYDEIGNQKKRIQVLKYLIVSSILNKNEINKFESQETKYFLKNNEILKFVKLLQSFDRLDNHGFTTLYKELLISEKSDPFMIDTLTKIRAVLKIKLLVHYIKPFKRVSLDRLSGDLRISQNDIEDIFLKLRANGEVPNVRLDLVDGIVYNE